MNLPMSTKKRLTWSQQPSETGLARIMQGERGRVLKVNGVKVGTVNPLYRGLERTRRLVLRCPGRWSAPAQHLRFSSLDQGRCRRAVRSVRARMPRSATAPIKSRRINPRRTSVQAMSEGLAQDPRWDEIQTILRDKE